MCESWLLLCKKQTGSADMLPNNRFCALLTGRRETRTPTWAGQKTRRSSVQMETWRTSSSGCGFAQIGSIGCAGQIVLPVLCVCAHGSGLGPGSIGGRGGALQFVAPSFCVAAINARISWCRRRRGAWLWPWRLAGCLRWSFYLVAGFQPARQAPKCTGMRG
jgi:hypothetical protein